MKNQNPNTARISGHGDGLIRTLAVRMTCTLLVAFLIANSTRACFVCRVPYQSLLDKIESGNQVVVARAMDESLSRWQIVRVIKSSDNLVADQIRAVKNSGLITPGTMQLLRRAAAGEAWAHLGTIDQEHLAFLTRAVDLSSRRPLAASGDDQQQRLSYFVPFLEHANPQIADSAFHKILNAPYQKVRTLGQHLDPDSLLELIKNPQLARKRRSLYITLLGTCGGQREATLLKQWIDERSASQNSGDLAALLAAHIELNGEETVKFIEDSYIRNRARKLGEIIEAIAALSLHGQAEGTVSRSRIAASFHLFLDERPPLLEMIIEDCTRWQDWSFAPKVMEIYAGGKQPWNNAMILRYLADCPLPAAQEFVRQETDRSSTAGVIATQCPSP
jgi:hypothetical protein